MSIAVKELAIDEVVKTILETRYEAFSSEDIENAKDRMIDVVGCAIGGANASGNKALLSLVRSWGGSKEATVLVHGDRVPVGNAAMMNAVMCRSYDYETCGPQPLGKAQGRMTGHICGTTECTALAIADMKSLNGKEVLAAAIVGGDLAARIAVVEDFAFENSFDITGTVNAFGATAVAGRLLKLTAPQMANAFGILVNEIAGSFQSIWDGVHTFKLHQGMSARNAILSVELSARGFTGIKDPLFSPRGYFPQYCKSFQPELLTEELGKLFYTKGSHKLRPSCYGNHAAIECCLEIMRQNEVKADDIVEVVLGVSESTLKGFLNQTFEMGDSEEKALFNLPYGVANILLRKETKIRHYTSEFIRDPKVLELAKKVKLVQGAGVDSRTQTEVTIRMKDGKQFTARIGKPRGYFETALTRDEIKNKYWDNYDHMRPIQKKNAEKALEMLENLESVSDVSKLVKLLVP